MICRPADSLGTSPLHFLSASALSSQAAECIFSRFRPPGTGGPPVHYGARLGPGQARGRMLGASNVARAVPLSKDLRSAAPNQCHRNPKSKDCFYSAALSAVPHRPQKLYTRDSHGTTAAALQHVPFVAATSGVSACVRVCAIPRSRILYRNKEHNLKMSGEIGFALASPSILLRTIETYPLSEFRKQPRSHS